MEEKVIEILKQVLETDNISISSNQDNTDNWDSMHQLMLASELEDAFDVSIEPEEIAEMTSVDGILKVLSSK